MAPGYGGRKSSIVSRKKAIFCDEHSPSNERPVKMRFLSELNMRQMGALRTTQGTSSQRASLKASGRIPFGIFSPVIVLDVVRSPHHCRHARMETLSTSSMPTWMPHSRKIHGWNFLMETSSRHSAPSMIQSNRHWNGARSYTKQFLAADGRVASTAGACTTPARKLGGFPCS